MPVLLIPLALMAGCRQVDTLQQLQELINRKDVVGLTAMLDAKPEGRSPFYIIKAGGAYGVGRFGWKPIALDPKGSDRHFIVLSTKLTSEDSGEILLERTSKGLHLIPEDDALGLGVIKHDFDVKFELEQHEAILTDRVTFETHRPGLAFFRMGSQYIVDSIDGKPDELSRRAEVLRGLLCQG